MPLLFHIEEEGEEETLSDPKCSMHHISDTKLDIKQYTQTHINIHVHHRYKNNKIIIYFGVGDFY